MENTVKCYGDCNDCQSRRDGKVNPAQCASIFGFMKIQQSVKAMREIEQNILNAIDELKNIVRDSDFDIPIQVCEEEEEINGNSPANTEEDVNV